MKKKTFLQKLPENAKIKAKAFVNRFKEDWKALNTAEKIGVVALGIATSIPLAGLATDVLGRYEYGKKHKKLEKVI